MGTDRHIENAAKPPFAFREFEYILSDFKVHIFALTLFETVIAHSPHVSEAQPL